MTNQQLLLGFGLAEGKGQYERDRFWKVDNGGVVFFLLDVTDEK